MSMLLDSVKVGAEYGFKFGSQEIGVEVVRLFDVGLKAPHPYIRLQVVSCDADDSAACRLVCGFFIDCPLDDFKAIAWQRDEFGNRWTFIPDAPPNNGIQIDVEAK